MPSRGYPVVPAFLIPVAAFFLWLALLLSYLPVLQSDLDFSRQIVLANLYFSNLILILTWFLCGQILFAAFALTFAVIAVYLMLDLGDWGVGIQILILGALYLWLRHISERLSQERLQKMVERDKIQERLNMAHLKLDEKDQLIGALVRKRDRLIYMREFSDHLKGLGSVEEVGRVITREVSDLLPEADQVLLFVYDETQRELALVSQVNRDIKWETRERRGSEYDDWVIKRSQPLLIEDTRTDFRFMTETHDKSPFRSLCLVPLLSKSSLCGVLRIGAAAPERFQTDDMRLMDIVADLSAVVMRNIVLYEKTKELSIMDSLTGCYLRRYVQDRMAEEIHRCLRSRAPFSLLMIDIDHFKKWNDEHGHTVGDLVLRHVARMIRECASASDIVGRYGGEEFIVLMPQKEMREALAVAEGIREALRKPLTEPKTVRRPLSVSIGIAQFPADGSSKEELLVRADQRLYKAKREGRDRVAVED